MNHLRIRIKGSVNILQSLSWKLKCVVANMGARTPVVGPKINLWGCSISDKKNTIFFDDFCEIMNVFTPSGLLKSFQHYLDISFVSIDHD